MSALLRERDTGRKAGPVAVSASGQARHRPDAVGQAILRDISR